MLLTVIVFILILSVIVFAHELGHFWTARKFGAKVEEFGFGLPPRIFGYRKKNGQHQLIWGKGKGEIKEDDPTIYSLNWIPVGGFVKIKGEDGEAKEDKNSFGSKPIWQKAIILSSGVIMNVVLCAVLLIIGFGVGLPAVTDGQVIDNAIVSDAEVRVVGVLDGLPAKSAGLKFGDVITRLNNEPVLNSEQMKQYLTKRVGQTVSVTIKRGNQELNLDIKSVAYQETAGFGIAITETAMVRYPWPWAIWQGIKATFTWLITIIVAFAMIIKNLTLNSTAGVEVSGPVGIAVMTGQFARLGWVYVLQFTALLSLNLAIINFIPFPALDGGRVLFLVIEKLRRKPMRREWENLSHNIGFILLMVLVVVITYRDVIRYGGKIMGSLKGLVGL